MADNKKIFTRQEAFVEVFNKLKEQGEFLFDDLVKGIDELYVKKNKNLKSNLRLSKKEARLGLKYCQGLGLKIREETIHKVIIEQ